MTAGGDPAIGLPQRVSGYKPPACQAGQLEQAPMTKSELIDMLARKNNHLPYKEVESAVKMLIEQMSESLSIGRRIEIRGFGSFSLHFRPPRTGRNPKTGAPVPLSGKHVPHFKPGKELRERVNASRESVE
jgi:integration host factor subunit beta